jgi:sugar phosphate isomerase/epimerase
MKLGVVGLMPAWPQIDRAAAERVRAAGYRGVSIFFDKPLEADPAAVRKLKTALDEADLEAAQANGWYEVLVHPDEATRAQGVAGLEALTRIGRALDARTVYVRPGSLNPHGAWYPHPDNSSPRTWEHLVASLRQAAATAQREGMVLAIEGHVLSLLDTPQRMRALIEAVGSPALRFNTDPVNFIGTVHDVYDNGPLLDALVSELGPVTAAAHFKDLALHDALVLHIDEVVIGEGHLDYGRLLPQLEALDPEMYGIIEHLPDEKIPLAQAGLLKAAQRAGVKLSGSS